MLAVRQEVQDGGEDLDRVGAAVGGAPGGAEHHRGTAPRGVGEPVSRLRQADVPLRAAGGSGPRPVLVADARGRREDRDEGHSGGGGGTGAGADRRTPAFPGARARVGRGRRTTVRRAAEGGGPPGGGAKRGLAAAFHAETAREVTALLGPDVAAPLDFEALEVALRRRALQLAARLLAQHLNADTSDYAGPWLPCVCCGGPARYAGRHAKTFTTVLGPLPLTRAYYHCAACAQGFCPRDRALGVDGTALSPAVTRMVGTAAALVSFAEGSALLGDLAGLTVPAKQVERTAEALGREIAADEREQVVPAEAAEIAPTRSLGLDGTGVPMRTAELAGRPGKQGDGSAKTREVKLCTVWSAEGRDTAGVPVRAAGSVSYSE